MLGIYCRTSKQRDIKYTLENQKDGGIKCAKELGLMYRIYVDDGISGTLDESVRGGLAELFKDIRLGELTHVYVIDQSRIERESNTWKVFVSLSLNHNILYYPGGNFYNLDDPTSRMLAEIHSIFNGYFSEITGKKVRLANAKKASRGLTHGLLPYGYSRDDSKNFVICENEAKYVRLMFKLSLEGNGAYTIANILNNLGVPTKFSGNFKGKIKRTDEYTKIVRYFDKEKVKWRGNVISDILKNPVYKGDRIWRMHEEKIEFKDGKTIKRKEVAEIITAKIPNIIEPDFFDEVQKNFILNKKKVGRRDIYKYLLNGIIFCEKCGSTYRGKKRLKGNDNAYKCSGKLYPNTSCLNRGVSIPKFDTFIINYLLFNEIFKKRIYDVSRNESNDFDFSQKIKTLETNLSSLQKKHNRVLDLLMDPEIVEITDLKKVLKSLKMQIDSKSSELEILYEKQAMRSNDENKILKKINEISSKLNHQNVNFNDLKKTLHSIIDWISINHNKKEKGGEFLVKLKIKNVDEVHYLRSDWGLMKWDFLDILEKINKKTIEEAYQDIIRTNFDIQKEVKDYIILTEEQYKLKYFGEERQKPRTDIRLKIQLKKDDIFNFDNVLP